MRNYLRREKRLNTLKKWSSLIDALNKEYRQSKIIKQIHPTKLKQYEQLFHRY
jgi:hypothetical protein